MMKLISFAPSMGVRAPSPFAVKAEALLAMSGLPYEVEFGDPRKTPRGKLPVLIDGARTIPDSAHIQHYLETGKQVDFDSHLTAADRAIATAFRRLIEHHIYFLNAHFRWEDHPDAVRDNYFAEAPAFLRGLIFRKVWKQLKTTLYLQGLGRHTRPEMMRFLKEDIDAIAVQLADKPFFLGDKPSSIDASLYGALHNLIDIDIDTPGTEFARAHANLVDYCRRFADTVFNGKSA